MTGKVILMKIQAIKSLGNGTKGVEVEGTVKRVFDPVSKEGKYGPWTVQNFVLDDGFEEILVGLANKQISKALIGKKVILSNCSVRSYNKDGNINFMLDMKKGSEIFEGDDNTPTVEVETGTVEKAVETAEKILNQEETVVNTKKTYAEYMLEATNEIMEVVTDENFKKMWANMAIGDLSSEDVRSFIISNIIAKQRG